MKTTNADKTNNLCIIDWTKQFIHTMPFPGRNVTQCVLKLYLILRILISILN